MSNNLKILAGQIISETKLSKGIKLQLLNFIQKEATESQIKVLLMDGKIVKLDEQAEEIVNDRFKSHKLNESAVVGAAAALVGGVVAIQGIMLGASLWAIYRVFKATLNKRKARCGVLSIGFKRKVCLLQVDIDEAKKMMDLMTKNMSSCKDAKNPDKCKEKHKKAIAKFKAKYEKGLTKMIKYNTKKPEKTQQGIERSK